MIYIFGHKNPDTDSVCAAITLSYLQNALGYDTEPRILSNINDETKYILKKFKIKIPEILDDVNLQVKDINYHKDFKINYNETLYNAYLQMKNNSVSTIPVVDNHNNFIGLFTMNDIVEKEINLKENNLNANYEDILNILDGKEILKFDDTIIGKIVINNDNLDNDCILISNNTNIIEESINNKIKLLILSKIKKIDDKIIQLAKKNKVNIIITSLDIQNIIIKIKFANHIKDYQFNKNIICVDEEEEFSELKKIITKNKHSYYPVINRNNKCLGLLKASDLTSTNPKKVILVDHNEMSQSADGLNEAEIISIVDHHRLGNLGTNQPINFRNMTVGSTCTIIYEMYRENKVKIPEHIAALLLSGIISDTLYLKSPTTTKEDEKVFNELKKVVNVNVSKLAMEMFKANDVTNSKTLKEVIYSDFKTFEVDNKIIAISNIATLNSKLILKQKNSYINFLNKESEIHNYSIMILSITDIFKNGSYLLFNQKSLNNIKSAFGENIEQGDFIKNLVSRKKQILPAIISTL